MNKRIPTLLLAHLFLIGVGGVVSLLFGVLYTTVALDGHGGTHLLRDWLTGMCATTALILALELRRWRQRRHDARTDQIVAALYDCDLTAQDLVDRGLIPRHTPHAVLAELEHAGLIQSYEPNSGRRRYRVAPMIRTLAKAPPT